jgi:hypothetical protein
MVRPQSSFPHPACRPPSPIKGNGRRQIASAFSRLFWWEKVADRPEEGEPKDYKKTKNPRQGYGAGFYLASNNLLN